MKYSNLKKLNLLTIIILLSSFKGFSQNSPVNSGDIMGTILTTGNDATGSSGSVTYSIGQVFYTYIGKSVYNVAQGIQHQEINTFLGTEDDIIKNDAEIFVFPNPTTDFVKINMKGLELEEGQQTYQLFDIHGRLIEQNKINQTETQISLSNLSSSLYILQVSVNNEIFKTFKIIKK